MISTDQVVHELYQSDEVREQVVDRWGAGVLDSAGNIDRSAVAAHAFADAGERAWLEGVLWPRVGARVMAWREHVLAMSEPPVCAVVETPLLFESGMDAAYDATIAVIADEAVRRERAGARGHAAIAEREQRQLSQEEKAARATYVLHNSGTVADLERECSGVLAKLGG